MRSRGARTLVVRKALEVKHGAEAAQAVALRAAHQRQLVQEGHLVPRSHRVVALGTRRATRGRSGHGLPGSRSTRSQRSRGRQRTPKMRWYAVMGMTMSTVGASAARTVSAR